MSIRLGPIKQSDGSSLWPITLRLKNMDGRGVMTFAPVSRPPREPRPVLYDNRLLKPGSSRTGWVTFSIASGEISAEDQKPSDLHFYLLDGSRGYVGVARLWRSRG
jgi:hypothetical protein